MSDRLKVALHLLYATGLRLSEVVAARAGDLTWVSIPPDEADAETVDGWLLTVLGKGNKLREVPVPYEVTSELSAYFESRCLDSDLEEGDNRDAYLLGKVPDDVEAKNVPRRPRRADFVIDPRDGIAASTLYDQIKAFFADCGKILAEQKDARGAERFAQASTHWMRHTHASHSIANGTPIQVAQQNLGHASLATTTIYVTTEKKERLKKMGAFWAQAAERRRGTVAVAPGAGESVDARGRHDVVEGS
jgi:site-specific recombinase XerD